MRWLAGVTVELAVRARRDMEHVIQAAWSLESGIWRDVSPSVAVDGVSSVSGTAAGGVSGFVEPWQIVDFGHRGLPDLW